MREQGKTRLKRKLMFTVPLLFCLGAVAVTLTFSFSRHGSVYRLGLEYSPSVMNGLLHTAAEALRLSFERGEIFPPPGTDNRQDRGVAVRFKRDHRDRACFTYWKAVRDMSAAVRSAVYMNRCDPRYEPLLREELDALVLEVTVFGRFVRASGPFDFIPGKETVLLEYQGKTTLIQASLLPERTWTKTQYIEAICRKAGLSADAWKNPELTWFHAPSISRELPYPTALGK